MQTRRPADTSEPEIKREEILLLRDDNFSQNNVCLVTGAATGIGFRSLHQRWFILII